ncbi:MAG: DEAD/DEAH box helicase, partial [Candidatus Freyarchaeota archaeon]
TGKSQTIANIIAECIARGKTVLFVSEKMAALEVVYKRLKEVGLDDFCLELHSHKANKREVVRELSRCLEHRLSYGTLQLPTDTDFKKMKRLRGRLNGYVESLHQRRQPLGRSVYEVLGELSKLKRFPFVPIGLSKPEDLKPEELVELEDLATRLKGVWRIVEEDSPWTRYKGSSYTARDRLEILHLLDNLKSMIDSLESELNQYLSQLGLDVERPTLNQVKRLMEFGDLLEKCPKLEPGWVTNPSVDQLIFEAVQQLESRIAERYAEGIYSLDVERLVRLFEGPYRSRWRWLRLGFYRDRGRIASMCREKRLPEDVLSDLLDIQVVKEFREKHGRPEKAPVKFAGLSNRELREKFGSRFTGHNTDWRAIIFDLQWAKRIQKEVKDLFSLPMVSKQIEDIVCGFTDTPSRERLKTLHEKVLRLLEQLEKVFETEPAYGGQRLSELDLRTISERVKLLRERIDDIPLCLRLREIKREFSERGLKGFFDQLIQLRPSSSELIFILRKAVYREWIEAVSNMDSNLREFQREVHEEWIKEFRHLDEKLIKLSPNRVIRYADRRKPPRAEIEAKEAEVNVLRREASKKRRLMPIRELFRKIPNLLFLLKPCLFMSPVSVSRFLSPDMKFDLVIFDEASQTFPWDAIGAIYRGRTIVVAGDDKQLPPTSFFQRTLFEERDWEELSEHEVEVFDSILEECKGIGLPVKMLRWHYRSRHEDLIAFSNHRFYNGSLITFPSAFQKHKELGVKFVYVEDGVYYRGASQTNPKEAEVVAKLVFDHFKRYRDRKSLGVVTFSIAQMEAVEDAIERRLKEQPEFERFLKEDRLHGFFVKNLENVQGDERDVIIISIGYGRDPTGRMTMQFGPLNKPGGERRLNVAITRAREKVILVSSIKASDIDLKATKAAGVLNLYLYLKYAEEGPDTLNLSIPRAGEYESPLEEDVAG